MDYDVGVLGLSSPPVAAVRTQYRPAVQVRNNGIHDALASGYLRIYSAGLLIFETEVYSGTLAPAATGLAQGVDYWTPPHEGTYIINGYVSTPLDQHEPNNNLAPVTIHVSGEEPPPPPVVTAHASQHEEGGTDELSIDGLLGRAADPQTPLGHQLSHRAGAADELNLDGLHGVLADGQLTGPHHTNHQQTGSDEINLDGLHGQAADPQLPTAHAGSHVSAGGDPIDAAQLIPQPTTSLSLTNIPANSATTLLSKLITQGKFKDGLILHAIARINWSGFLVGNSASFYFKLTPAGHDPEYTTSIVVPVEQSGNSLLDVYLHVYEFEGNYRATLHGVCHSSSPAPGTDLDAYFESLGSSGPINPDHQVSLELMVNTDPGVTGNCWYALCEYSGNT